MPPAGNFLEGARHFMHSIVSPRRRGVARFKPLVYILAAVILALLISLIFGHSYDANSQKLKGQARRLQKRQVPPTKAAEAAAKSPSDNLKDPFANRPRIRTRNGHLVIEASQDKNIDFKTSGSRGSVTVNGFKLDQLVGVARALEKTQSGGAGEPLLGSSGVTGGQPNYEQIVTTLYGTSQRFASIERSIAELSNVITSLNKTMSKLSKRTFRRLQQVSQLAKNQDSMLASLRRNDCFNKDTGQPVCRNGATCVDSYESFRCICPPNFEGPTCEQDVDECLKFRGTDLGCQNGAKCTNIVGGYQCECPAQYHGVHCTEQHDDCSMSSSRSLCANGKCLNLARTQANQPRYECVCDQGWTTDGANPACTVDINECLAGQFLSGGGGGGGQLALNSTGDSPLDSSSSRSIAWSSSLAAYPCSQNPFVECVNLPGTFQCGPCPPGYSGNGRVCRDVDECAQNNGGCSTNPFVECVNLAGGKRCGSCPPGYTGDGVTCLRSSPCSATPNGGCHPMAKCLDLPNLSASSRLCICDYPYVGQGVGERGCKLASLINAGPSPAGNATGAANATQPAEQSIELAKQDDCSPNPCLNGASCELTANSFECLCYHDWTGRYCELKRPATCGTAFWYSSGSLGFPFFSSYDEFVRSNKTLAATAPKDRKFRCLITISVSSNQSLRLALRDVVNKLEPNRRIQMFLANNGTSMASTTNATKTSMQATGGGGRPAPHSGTGRHQTPPPACAEYVDVIERQPDFMQLAESTGGGGGGAIEADRLLARLCASAPRGSPAMMTDVDKSKELILLAETNTVLLHYSFAASTSADPVMNFSLQWNKYEPPCGGELPTADSGSISSPRFPDFYEAGVECRYVIRVPPRKRIRMQFGELNLLSISPGSGHAASASGNLCADSLVIIDGAIGFHRPVLFKYCANNSTIMHRAQSPPQIVSSSSTVEVILTSRSDSTTPLMKPKQKRGFYLTYASEPSIQECGGLFTAKSAIIKSGDYETMPNPSASSSELTLAHQMSTYFDIKSNRPIGRLSTDAAEHQSVDPQPGYSNWHKFRCEYEIRPADQGRNHKISLDWLEMPTDQVIDASALGSWTRRMACTRGQLIVYDGNPADGTNRTAIASFCSGDRYNASLPQLAPVISSGHVLYLVYESLHLNPGKVGSYTPAGSAPGNLYAHGFRLKYSTVCTAIYYKLSDRIRAELDLEVSECVYHIMLPPNNTISLVIEPKMSPSMYLPDGSCAAQAIFMDGAIQRTASALVEAERQLRTYNFYKTPETSTTDSAAAAPPANKSQVVTRSGADLSSLPATGGDDPMESGESAANSESTGSAKSQDSGASGSGRYSYWQYSSSDVHDIKEFEVCKSTLYSFDSVWNHLSLMFRLNPRAKSQMADQARDSELASLSASPRSEQNVYLWLRYQAEPACGGIITEPREGSIELESSRKVTGINNYPLTLNKYEHYHMEQVINPCAWIIKNSANHVIQLEFQAPANEIRRRYDEWQLWSAKNSKLSQKNGTLVQEEKFNCSSVFQETVEIYEPSMNRTKYLCPLDLVLPYVKFTSQSDTLLIRLRNTTTTPVANSSSSNKPQWPGKRPLIMGSDKLVVKYSMLKLRDSDCGGKLIHDSGIITSPRFPFNYPAHSTCVWIIEANPQQQIRLNFTKFELEKQSNCHFDYLELRNGPSLNSPLIGRFCNQDLQSKVLVSQSSFLRLEFRSDAHLNRAGFQIYYDGAQTGCGGRLTTPTGQIDSPNYPLAYAHSAECDWAIEVNPGNRVRLTVEDLDLSSDSEIVNACPRSATSGYMPNYLEIFDSGPEFGANSLGRFCHYNQIKSNTSIGLRGFMSSSNQMLLTYKSQALDKSRGFRMSYETQCLKNELVGYQGAVESPGYPSSYAPFSACSWFIRGPLGSNLTLQVADLELEEGNDQSYRHSGSSLLTSASGPFSNDTTKRRRCNDVLKIYSVDVKWNRTSLQQERVELPSLSLMESSARPSKFVLVRTLCGSFENLTRDERVIELAASGAYVTFSSDRSVDQRGFRLEWQAKGCGGHQAQMSRFSPEAINFDEPANGRPLECLWTIDASKSSNTLELHLDSKMQLPDPSVLSATNKSSQWSACDEASLTVYDGLTPDSSVLSQNCDAIKLKETIETSSGKALIRFLSTGNHKQTGRYFTLRAYPGNRDSCMPYVHDISTPFNQQAGTAESPNYPDLYNPKIYRCQGGVISHLGRMMIKLDQLEIPVPGYESATSLLSEDICKTSSNYLLLTSYYTRTIESYYCGKLDPVVNANRSVVVYEQEAVSAAFATKSSLQGKWRFTYQRLCGSKVVIDTPMDFATPNYPLEPKWPTETSKQSDDSSENVCIWRLKADPSNFRANAKSAGAKMRIHVSIANFISPSTVSKETAKVSANNKRQMVATPMPTSDCLRIYEGVNISLRQHKFNLTDMDLRLQPKVKICSEFDLRHDKLYYISEGEEITLLISGDAIAKVRARPFDDYCGGEHHQEQAEFSSPNYPLGYGQNSDCIYQIIGSPGSNINLEFLKFDLPEPQLLPLDEPSATSGKPTMVTSCDNVDYVEIRQLSRWRQQQVRFRKLYTDTWASRYSDSAFLTQKEEDLARGNMSSKLTPRAKRILEMAKLYYNLADTSSSRSVSKVFQGFGSTLPLNEIFEESKLIGRFCGKKAPQFVQPLRDEILIRFRSHASDESLTQLVRPTSGQKQARGFLLKYKIDYGGTLQVTTKDGDGLISSPKFPLPYRSNRTIQWNLETTADSVLQFDLVAMNLGSSVQECQDTLTVFDGLNRNKARVLSELCGHLSFKSLAARRAYEARKPQAPLSPSWLPLNLAHNSRIQTNLLRTIRSSANVASIVYDNTQVKGSFLLRYRAVQKSSLPTNLTSDELTLNDDLDLANTSNKTLSEIRRDPAKFCSSNYKLAYGTNGSQRVILTSPNWPNEPPHDIECHWMVYTTENAPVSLSIDPIDTTANGEPMDSLPVERYDSKYDYCLDSARPNDKRNYIAVHDGASPFSPLIGRYCLPAPPLTLMATGRHMLIRYVHADRYEIGKFASSSQQQQTPTEIQLLSRSIFKARAAINTCGGQFYIMHMARVSDRRGQSQFYANNLDCKYYLFASSPDRILSIGQANKFNLSSEPTNADCSVGDYIEIRELTIQNEQLDFSRSATSGRSLGRYCAGKKLDEVESWGPAISIEFHTDGANVGTGFDLWVESRMPRNSCPTGFRPIRLSEDSYGRLISPNWPQGTTMKRRCGYLFIAKPNQTVQLEFVRLRRPKSMSLDLTDSSGRYQCVDKFHYLDDDEATEIRYSNDKLSEFESPESGELLRALVQEMPCYLRSRITQTVYDYSNTPIDVGDSGIGYKTIQADEYQKLLIAAPPTPLMIKSRSHTLALQYEAKNLAHNEGFVALVRSVDRRESRCGGIIQPMDPRELATKERRSASSSSVDSGVKLANLIELSADLFQVASMPESPNDQYVQCEWEFNIPPGSYQVQYKIPIDLQDVGVENFNDMNKEKELGFKMGYLVYEYLEIPPRVPGTWLLERDWTDGDKAARRRSMDTCGLSRYSMLMDSHSGYATLMACGNVTGREKWHELSNYGHTASVRVKKQLIDAKSPANQVNYRGVRAYAFESACPRFRVLPGETVDIRSHLSWPNASYAPGICEWKMSLPGGDYALWFDRINFRPPASYKAQAKANGQLVASTPARRDCDISDSDLDYVEVRSSTQISGNQIESPVVMRYCFYNQLEAKRLPLNVSVGVGMSVTFAAGLRQLEQNLGSFNGLNSQAAQTNDPKQPDDNLFGFSMRITRERNSSLSEFCQRNGKFNLYSMVRPIDLYFESRQRVNSLYSANAHCVIQMSSWNGQAFNFTFKGLFDLEQSRDCQNDYIKIEDIGSPATEGADFVATNVTTTQAPKTSTISHNTPQPKAAAAATTTVASSTGGQEPAGKLIGKWCGRNKPAGYFVSQTNRIRITFHSNERVEGKGFFLVYKVAGLTSDQDL